jgi:hypothetical protein
MFIHPSNREFYSQDSWLHILLLHGIREQRVDWTCCPKTRNAIGQFTYSLLPWQKGASDILKVKIELTSQ